MILVTKQFDKIGLDKIRPYMKQCGATSVAEYTLRAIQYDLLGDKIFCPEPNSIGDDKVDSEGINMSCIAILEFSSKVFNKLSLCIARHQDIESWLVSCLKNYAAAIDKCDDLIPVRQNGTPMAEVLTEFGSCSLN